MKLQEIIKAIKANKSIRLYKLKDGKTPPYYEIRTRHIDRNPLYWFDEELSENRVLRYSKAERSVFKEDQSDSILRSHLGFKDGVIKVQPNDFITALFLTLHPDNGVIWDEVKDEEDAAADVEVWELKAEALDAVKSLDVNDIEMVAYNLIGEEVFNTSSKELKRDVYLLADRQPKDVINILSNDFYKRKYVARRAVREGVLNITPDGRAVTWLKTTKKVYTVPIDVTPYDGLAEFFTTDDGLEYLPKIVDKLK